MVLCADGISPIQQYAFALGFSFVDQIGTEDRYRRCSAFNLILDRRQEEDKKLEFPVFRVTFGK